MTNRPAPDDPALSPGEWADIDALAAPEAIPPLQDDAEAVDGGLEGPAAKYARLTRRALAAVASPDAGAGEGGWGGGAETPPAARGRPLTPPSPSRPGWGRRMVMAAVMIGLACGAFLAISTLAASDRERVADLAELAAFDVQPLNETDPRLAEQLDVALNAVAEARDASRALVPSYDPAVLDAAATRLAHLVSEADPQTPVSQEGRLALGRILLYQDRDAEAVRVLGSLVREGGYRGPEARRLLDFIRTVESG